MRMVTSTDMGSGDAVFEWAAQAPHHHLVCTACGAAIEFDHEYLEELNRAISTDFGFQADMHHFAIFGLCRGCRVEEEIG
ncbi:MAG: transcriptional repressor, partial [Dehalococcoidia bacterium]